MFDHEMGKAVELGIWFFQHAYVLLIIPIAIFIVALTVGGDK
jgi:hypothetical protein